MNEFTTGLLAALGGGTTIIALVKAGLLKISIGSNGSNGHTNGNGNGQKYTDAQIDDIREAAKWQGVMSTAVQNIEKNLNQHIKDSGDRAEKVERRLGAIERKLPA